MKETVYLLTDAVSFLGITTARTLIAQGKKVRALVSGENPATGRIPPEVEIVKGNVLNTASLNEFFSVTGDYEIVVLHTANFVTFSPEWDQTVYDINVIGTEKILIRCLKYKVKKLVYISSTSAIPELPKGRVITEIDSFDPDAVVGCYSQTKAEATQLVLDAAQYKGLDASIVYASAACGPGDFENGPFTKFMIRRANDTIPAGIAGTINPVDIRDLAEGVIACSEKGRAGEGYIMSGSPVPVQNVLALIRKSSGAPEIRHVLPVQLLKFLTCLARCFGRITKKTAIRAAFFFYIIARNKNFDSSKAARELGFKTRPLEETIQDMFDWLRAEGRIVNQLTENNEQGHQRIGRLFFSAERALSVRKKLVLAACAAFVALSFIFLLTKNSGGGQSDGAPLQVSGNKI